MSDVSSSPSSPQPSVPAQRSPNDWRRLHLWQIQPVRDLLTLACVFLVVWLGYQARLVTVPLLVALLLAYLFEPFVRWVTRGGRVSRKGAAMGIIAAIALAVVIPLSLGVGFAVVQGVGFAAGLSQNIRLVLASVDKPDDQHLAAQVRGESWKQIRNWLVEHKHDGGGPAAPQDGAPGSLPPMPEAPAPVDTGHPAGQGPAAAADAAAGGIDASETSPARMIKTLMTWVEQNAAGIASAVGKTAVGSGAQAVEVVLGTFASIGGLLFRLFLSMFFFFFFCTGWGRVLAWAEKFIPHSGKYRWMQIINRMDRAIAGFVRGRLTICAIEAVFMTIAFWFIGLPAPLLLGPLVGALFIVPFMPALMVPVNMLLLWLQSDAAGFRAEWYWIVFAPVVCHVCGQILDDYILTPRIQGENTDLEMPTILFSSLAGGALAGVYGLLLAIPVAACVKILAKELLWPRIEKWVRGEVVDPLPISRE